VACVAVGCGDPLFQGTFTSRVVQLETCRVVGEGSEGCTRAEQFAERRFDIVEVEEGLFWLYGLPRDGVADRAILGSADAQGGFLFVDERRQENSVSGCVLTTRTSVSLTIDPDGVDKVGSDPCVALLGRSVDTVTASPACDTNVPAQQVIQIVRRRFEALGPESTCGEAGDS
jgi:hypothetical protein